MVQGSNINNRYYIKAKKATQRQISKKGSGLATPVTLDWFF